MIYNDNKKSGINFDIGEEAVPEAGEEDPIVEVEAVD